MPVEIMKNGANGAPPPAAMVTTCWVRDDFANGRRRYKLHAMHVPLQNAVDPALGLAASHPRLAGNPMVIGEVELIVPNLEVARILLSAMSEMISKQPPEILQVKA